MLFGVHLHQPTDNFDSVIEKAVNECYGPFFELLSKYPEFKFAFHSSGWIFEKIKNEYRDVFDNIKKCSIEFFTGGFYEPILVSIPSADRITQIKKLNKFLKENFNALPKGLWLTERVWDDEIISDLIKCGIKYAIVDDYHFLASGYKKINGYYYTGMQEKIALFPISKALRYAIPFKKVDEAVKLLTNNLVMFDDIEKFGLWPGTNEWVYKKGWLREFIEKSISKTQYFDEYYKNNNSISYAFIENLSYEEMTEWCLDAEDIVKLKEDKKRCKSFFVKGSIWKRFLYKYPESNYLHKRMLEGKKNESYYKLQTNDVYWHGIFGGIYLPNLRDNAYKYLIECDNLENEIKDINFDGLEEGKYVFENSIFVFNNKGELIEFDDLEKKYNFCNLVSRKKEFYHIYKEKNKKNSDGIESIHDKEYKYDKKIYFDRYLRYSFITRNIKNIDYEKSVSDSYDYKESNYYVNFKDKEIIASNDSVKKEIILNDKKMQFCISSNKNLVTQINLHLTKYKNIKEGAFEGDKIVFDDSFLNRKIVLKFNCSKYFIYLIKTANLSENGIKETIQGICVEIINSNLKGEIYFE